VNITKRPSADSMGCELGLFPWALPEARDTTTGSAVCAPAPTPVPATTAATSGSDASGPLVLDFPVMLGT